MKLTEEFFTLSTLRWVPKSGSPWSFIPKAKTGDIIRLREIERPPEIEGAEKFPPDCKPSLGLGFVQYVKQKGFYTYDGLTHPFNGEKNYGEICDYFPTRNGNIIALTDREVISVSKAKKTYAKSFEIGFAVMSAAQHVFTDTVLAKSDSNYYLIMPPEKAVRPRFGIHLALRKKTVASDVVDIEIEAACPFHMGHPLGPTFFKDGEFVLHNVATGKKEVLWKAPKVPKRWFASANGIGTYVTHDEGEDMKPKELIVINDNVRNPLFPDFNYAKDSVLQTAVGSAIVRHFGEYYELFLPGQKQTFKAFAESIEGIHPWGIFMIQDGWFVVFVVK